MNASTILSWFIARASEPSTFAGAGIIATAIHAILPGAIGDSTLTVLQAASGLIAVIAAEKKAA